MEMLSKHIFKLLNHPKIYQTMKAIKYNKLQKINRILMTKIINRMRINQIIYRIYKNKEIQKRGENKMQQTIIKIQQTHHQQILTNVSFFFINIFFRIRRKFT